MQDKVELLTPVGRLVQGSLYDPLTTDAEGNPNIDKNGEPYVEYFFAMAIEKGQEKHWSETSWGQLIWAMGHKAFPNIASSPTFSWKIKDGDSTIQTTPKSRRPCDYTGFPGNWVLCFKTRYAFSICNDNGQLALTEKDYIKLGYYVRVFAKVSGNGATQQPGVYLRPEAVALIGEGDVINRTVDTKDIGFGKDLVIPAGCRRTSVAPEFANAPPVVPPTYTTTLAENVPLNPQLHGLPPVPAVGHSTAPMPPPHHGILTPPPASPAASQRVMLPAANGQSYEQMIAQGWTDITLVQYGMMQP